MNTIQYLPKTVRYMQLVFPRAHQSRRLLQPFLQGSLGDRPTDHATRSLTIGGVHSGEAKFCYRLQLQGVSLGQPESSTQTASRLLQPFLPGSIGD